MVLPTGVKYFELRSAKVLFSIKGRYREARPSVLEYIKSTSIVNPHAKVVGIWIISL